MIIDPSLLSPEPKLSQMNEQNGGDRIPPKALIGIICGSAALVVLVSIICFVLYRRQNMQIEELREMHLLKTGTSDFKVGKLHRTFYHPIKSHIVNKIMNKNVYV